MTGTWGKGTHHERTLYRKQNIIDWNLNLKLCKEAVRKCTIMGRVAKVHFEGMGKGSWGMYTYN